MTRVEEKVISCPECLNEMVFIEISPVNDYEPLFGNKECYYCNRCEIRVEIIRKGKWFAS